MVESQWRDEISAKIPQLQIIVGSLISGCVIFLAIAAFVAFQGGQAEPIGPGPIFTYIAILFGATAIVAAQIAPAIIVGRARRTIHDGSWRSPQGSQVSASQSEMLERCGDAGRLWLLYQTVTIVRAALIEGAAFFLLVVYIIERSPISLAGSLVMIFILASLFPGRKRALHWIEDQLNLLDQQRQFGP